MASQCQPTLAERVAVLETLLSVDDGGYTLSGILLSLAGMLSAMALGAVLAIVFAPQAVTAVMESMPSPSFYKEEDEPSHDKEEEDALFVAKSSAASASTI
jgi:hypothetical protein